MYMQTCSSCGRHRRSLRLLTWDFIFRNYLSLFLTTKLKQTEVYLISVNWSNWKWRKWNGVFFSRRWRHDSFQETRRFPFTEVRKINSVYEAGKGCWSTVQSNFPNDIFQSAATVTMATPDLPYSINSWGTRRSSEELPSTWDGWRALTPQEGSLNWDWDSRNLFRTPRRTFRDVRRYESQYVMKPWGIFKHWTYNNIYLELLTSGWTCWLKNKEASEAKSVC